VPPRHAGSTGARLNHQNVVRIYDIVEEDDHPWIVMELLPYRSLRDIVRDEGPLTPPRAAKVGLGIPAGFYRFTNPTGFSIGVPNGWQISHVGHYVYITDPNNAGIFLLIDQSDNPKPNPLADWEQQQANRESSYPDYHLIRLEAVNYPQAEKAAD
jgi:hypothetical protein